MPEIYSTLSPALHFDHAKHRLGSLCKRGHEWMNTGCSLRYATHTGCVQCAVDRAKKRAKENPEQHLASVLKSRAKNGRPSRSKGLSVVIPPHLIGHRITGRDLIAFEAAGLDLASVSPDDVKQQLALWVHIKGMRPSPSIAELVACEQKKYLQENPELYRAYCNERSRLRAKWRQTNDPDYVLYHRQKSKRRKAQMRNSVAIQITGKQIRARFAEFDHRCAYCSAEGDLHIEHVVPISRGGTHALGNIVPACKDCNFSKRDHDAERWYRRQPFYSDLRWRKICRVLGWSRSSVGQMALL